MCHAFGVTVVISIITTLVHQEGGRTLFEAVLNESTSELGCDLLLSNSMQQGVLSKSPTAST